MTTDTSTSVTVHIPTPLRSYTGNQAAVSVQGRTVGEALSTLVTKYAAIRPHLYSDEGRLRSFVNIYLNEDDIRYLQREETPLSPSDTLSIVPSIAGGR